MLARPSRAHLRLAADALEEPGRERRDLALAHGLRLHRRGLRHELRRLRGPRLWCSQAERCRRILKLVRNALQCLRHSSKRY